MSTRAKYILNDICLRMDDEDDEMAVNDQDVQRLVIVTQVQHAAVSFIGIP